jgi:hypothetical protein
MAPPYRGYRSNRVMLSNEANISTMQMVESGRLLNRRLGGWRTPDAACTPRLSRPSSLDGHQ